MAIGAGWQAIIAYVNIVCYYVFGVPLGLTLGYKLDMGVRVSVFSFLTFFFQWEKIYIFWNKPIILNLIIFVIWEIVGNLVWNDVREYGTGSCAFLHYL